MGHSGDTAVLLAAAGTATAGNPWLGPGVRGLKAGGSGSWGVT